MIECAVQLRSSHSLCFVFTFPSNVPVPIILSLFTACIYRVRVMVFERGWSPDTPLTFPSSYSFVVYDVQCCSKPLYLIAFNSLVHGSSRRIVYIPCQICLFIVDIAVPKMLTYLSVHSARPSTLDLRYMVQLRLRSGF
jgi:hypothetical protein